MNMMSVNIFVFLPPAPRPAC